MHLVRIHSLGIPQESRDAFTLLIDAGALDPALGDQMRRMVGFRNVAIHDYQQLNLEVVKNIIDHHLGDFTRFTEAALKTRGFRG